MIRAYKNVRLFDPSGKLDEVGALIVENGVIAARGAKCDIPADAEIIDAQGMMLLPGLVDMQVSIGEPGGEYRESLATASQAAAAGGVTSLIMTPNTDPVIDDAALVDYVSRRARDTAMVNIYPMACITQGLEGKTMTEFGLLREAGAVAFSDGNKSVMDSLVMRRAMTYAANFDALIIHHTMDDDLASAGVMHDGELAVRLGLPGIPEAAEVIMIERDLRLMELTGARYHIAQISCAESLKVIRNAKARGLQVTCGVSANHLMLNENDVQNYRTFAKLMPPLRSEQDRLALAEAVADGTIDVIVSAHNPQGEDAKRRPFEEAEYGSVGVETLLAASLSLYHDGIAGLDRLMSALTATPASLLGLEAGNLNIGSRADFSLLDLDAPWVVDGDLLHSRSKNAAIEGRKLQGKVMETVVAGQTIFRAEND